MKRIQAECIAGNEVETRIVKFMRLDEKYRVVAGSNPKIEIGSLLPGEKLHWSPAN